MTISPRERRIQQMTQKGYMELSPSQRGDAFRRALLEHAREKHWQTTTKTQRVEEAECLLRELDRIGKTHFPSGSSINDEDTDE